MSQAYIIKETTKNIENLKYTNTKWLEKPWDFRKIYSIIKIGKILILQNKAFKIVFVFSCYFLYLFENVEIK